LPADEFVDFNANDPDLATIRVALPKPPPYKSIEAYGLHPLEQKYIRPEMPERLAELNNRRYVEVEEYWDEIARNFDYYKDELWFIRDHWQRRIKGRWIFIKGKPYWIPPWHEYFLTACDLNTEIDNRSNYGINHPEYRDRDRRFFLIAHWCSDNPFVFGFNYPKHRREGATSKATAINNELASRSIKAITGIQSMTENDARDKVFTQFLVPMIQQAPFYFQPIAESYRDPKGKMSYMAGKSARYKSVMATVLGTVQMYGKSHRSAFDGAKLIFHHGDEEGKTIEENVLSRWRVNRKALSLGATSKIIGLHIATSTVGEMVRGGGNNFKRKCQDSDWRKRDATGQTETGLVTVFLPAEDGLDGFIDPWGFSVIEDPDAKELKYLPELKKKAELLALDFKEQGIDRPLHYMGSRSYINARREMYREAGKNDALSEEMRQTPQRFRECFTMNADECRFNPVIIQSRLQEFIVADNPFVAHGRFSWDDRWKNWNVLDPKTLPRIEDVVSGAAKVVWVPMNSNRENADWEISYLPKPEESMRFRFDDEKGLFVPDSVRFFGMGCDPQKIRAKTTTGKPSFSASVILRKRDSSIDLPKWGPHDRVKNSRDALLYGRMPNDHYHVTNRFCAVYMKRPTVMEDYAEQALMACLYYGCRNNPETNVTLLWDYFETRGFPGWLFYRWNAVAGEEAKQPGRHNSEASVNEIFNAIRDHIETNGHREVHMEFLEQSFDIRDVMHDYDVFTAAGMALLENNDRVYTFATSNEETIDLGRWEVDNWEE